MRNLLLIFLFAAMCSCSTAIKVSDLNEYDVIEKNDTFYVDYKPVAVFDKTEFECYEGNCTKEIFIRQFSDGMDSNTEAIMKYVCKMHPRFKIKMNFK